MAEFRRQRPIGIFGGTFDPMHRGHLFACTAAQAALDLAYVRVMPAGDPPLHAPPGASAAHRLAMVRLTVAGRPGIVVDGRETRREGRSFTVDTLAELRAELPDRPLVLLLGEDAFAGLPQWWRWRELLDFAHIVVWTRPGARREHADVTPAKDIGALIKTPMAATADAGADPETGERDHGSDRAELPSARDIDGFVPELQQLLAATRTMSAADLATAKNGRILLLAQPALALSATAIRARIAASQPTAGLLQPDVCAYIAQERLYV